MMDRENFLERWSRKKREAADTTEAPRPPLDADRGLMPTGKSGVSDASKDSGAKPQAPAPTFDVASLPPLEAITAASDIRAFLTPGVPLELTRAALRRAWVADPAIRDFVGLAENAWDFTKPDAMQGFGELPLDYDVKKLLAQLFDGPDKEAARAANAYAPTASPGAPQTQQSADQSAPPVEPAGAPPSIGGAGNVPPLATAALGMPAVAQPPGEFVQRDSHAASQHSSSEQSPEAQKNRRSHGGALPE